MPAPRDEPRSSHPGGEQRTGARRPAEPAPRHSVAAYIVHYRAESWCLDTVAALARSAGVRIQISVVDNSAPSPRLRRELPADVAVIGADANLGYAGAANLAIRHWRGTSPAADWLLLGSHDLLVEPDCVAELVAAGERSPDFGLLGPVLGPPTPFWGGVWNGYRAWQRGGPPRVGLPDLDGATAQGDDGGGRRDEPTRATAGDGSPEPGEGSRRGASTVGRSGAVATEPVEADWISGTCLLLRRSCVERVGEFDEDLHSYGEDLDYGLRCWDSGWKVGVVATAAARGRGSAIAERERLMARNGVLFAAKRGGYPGAARAGGFTAALALRLGARSLSPARTGEERRLASGRARALAAGLCTVTPREVRLFVRKQPAIASGSRSAGGSPPLRTEGPTGP